jgi:hypothetical protein
MPHKVIEDNAVKTAYHVEAERDRACVACGAGTLWTIVGPDDIAESTSWEDKELADDICEAMNDAYEKGVQSACARSAVEGGGDGS